MKNELYKLLAGVMLMVTFTSCKKFLDEKPNQKLATIGSIQDMQALMDNTTDMNYADPAMGECYGDNYYMTDAVLDARPEYDRNMYTFASANVFSAQYNAWNNCYTQVNIANTVLEAVDDYAGSQSASLPLIKAEALFFRGKAFYHALTIWALPYNANTAGSLPGIPLRLTANFNEKSDRATIAAGYAQTEADLKACVSALPRLVVSPVRPCKGAAYGMLSRLYLQMRNYDLAGKYADSCLQINNSLLDYNSLTTSANFPLPKLNAEVIFEGRVASVGLTAQARALVANDLYALYNTNDLRKAAYYKASGTAYIFKGSYETAATLFNGITTAEMYLTRAECFARAGEVNKALADINLLLLYRYKKGTFTALSAVDATSALALIKQERRKELAFRSMRFADLRRFNEEGDNITVSRTVNGKIYALQPKSKNYAIPIPEDVIALTGMAQN